MVWDEVAEVYANLGYRPGVGDKTLPRIYTDHRGSPKSKSFYRKGREGRRGTAKIGMAWDEGVEVLWIPS